MRSIRLSLAAILVGTAASTSSAVVIYDQYNNAGTSSYASQQFEPANVAFNCSVLDDFTVSSAVTVQSVDFSFVYFNGIGPVTNWHIGFFSSPAAAVSGNLVGDIADVSGIAGGQAAAPFPTFLSLNVGNIPLAAGTYWIGIQGVMNFTPNGQIGVTERLVISGSEARFINPGGGFGVGTNATLGTLAGAGQQRDVAFRLNGVPAPSTLALLGLGGLVARRRRR